MQSRKSSFQKIQIKMSHQPNLSASELIKKVTIYFGMTNLANLTLLNSKRDLLRLRFYFFTI